MAVQLGHAPGAHGAARGAPGLEIADERAEKPAHYEASPDVLLKGLVEAARVERQSIQDDESSCAATCSVDDGSSSRMSASPLHETDIGTSLAHLTGKRCEESEAQSEVRDQLHDVVHGLHESWSEMTEAQVDALLLCPCVLLSHAMEDVVSVSFLVQICEMLASNGVEIRKRFPGAGAARSCAIWRHAAAALPRVVACSEQLDEGVRLACLHCVGFFRGRIVSSDASSGKMLVAYDDGDHECMSLGQLAKHLPAGFQNHVKELLKPGVCVAICQLLHSRSEVRGTQQGGAHRHEICSAFREVA